MFQSDDIFTCPSKLECPFYPHSLCQLPIFHHPHSLCQHSIYFPFLTLGFKMVVRIKPKRKFFKNGQNICCILQAGFSSWQKDKQGLLLSRKWNVFKAIDWEIQFQPFFLYALVHQALIKHIEFEEKWSCISSSYLKKEKEFIYNKKKPMLQLVH